MAKSLLKIFLTVLSILVIAIILLIVFNSQIRDSVIYLLMPETAKYVNFLKLTNKEGVEIYLLGTWHHKHWTSKRYTLWHIEAVIDHLRPDILLIESRPEDLEVGHWERGPLEMLFAHLTARSMGIKVEGMDWWVMDPSKFGHTWKERDDRMFQNILKRIPGHGKILVLSGRAHIINFKTRFKKAGYSFVPFPKKEKKKLLDTSGRDFLFPAGMAAYIQRGIDRSKDLKYANILRKYLETVKKVGERQK